MLNKTNKKTQKKQTTPNPKHNKLIKKSIGLTPTNRNTKTTPTTKPNNLKQKQQTIQQQTQTKTLRPQNNNKTNSDNKNKTNLNNKNKPHKHKPDVKEVTFHSNFTNMEDPIARFTAYIAGSQTWCRNRSKIMHYEKR